MADNKLLIQNLEDVYAQCFGNYSKYIIQERSLPDIRDGLKPVQRRILYSMFVEGNVSSKPYRKSAKTVGFVIGNYHPHGDASVYDAMVRMSQSWKNSVTLIDMQGNNGSIDNDPAAAMRYTEARLSKIADEMLKNIEKDTVSFAPNYDDSLLEPTVLPALYPNLLVNGAKGIAAGYATEIPPHNLSEVIDATIHLIKHPKASLEDLMEYVKGPDFPTGAIIQGKEGLVKAYSTGSGMIKIVSKTEVREEKNLNQFIIHEIPYEVVKSQLVAKIDALRVNHTVEGIIEVRDESDRSGLKICIDIKKEADFDSIVNYLMKNTDLQVSYNFNMVTIANKTPKQLGLKDMLQAYIDHQIEVLVNLTNFDLRKAKERLHIVKALIIALSNLDEVIEIIKNSHGKQDSKTNLENRFGFDDKQSEAIVMLNLYRLNSTDIEEIREEGRNLEIKISDLEDILANSSRQRKIIASQLEGIKKTYGYARKSKIEDEITQFVVENKPFIKEDVYIALTRDCYYKRSSIKSFNSSDGQMPKFKNNDMLIGYGKASTADILLAFTDKGNYIYLPIYLFNESKWKDEGMHLNSLITLNNDEKIVSAFIVEDFNIDANIALVSNQGQISRFKLNKLVVQKYNKSIKCMSLNSNDFIVSAALLDGDSTITLINEIGKGYKIHETSVTMTSPKSKGTIALKNSECDKVGGMIATLKGKKDLYCIFTKQGAYRLFHTNQLDISKKGTRLFDIYKFFKTDPYQVASVVKLSENDKINIVYSNGVNEIKTLDSYQHSPQGKIIRANMNLEPKVYVNYASQIKLEVISKDMKTYNIEQVEEKKLTSEQIIDILENKKEKEKEKEELEAVQISIFDEFFE